VLVVERTTIFCVCSLRIRIMSELYLEPCYDEHDCFRIVEVPSDFDAALPLHMSNDEDGHLIVCSSATTFSVRKVEYSNSLLVNRKRGRNDSTVIERQTRMFEVTKCNPRTLEVIDQLRQNFVTLTDLENPAIPTAGLSLPQLATVVSCSFLELRGELVKNGALIVGGNVRLVHPSVINQAVNAVLLFLGAVPFQIDENSLVVNWIDVVNHCVPSMFPRVLLDSVRALLSDSTTPNNKCGNVSLSLDRLLRRAAACTLESMAGTPVSFVGDAKQPLHWASFLEFFELWKCRLPQGLLSVVANDRLIEVLRGYVLFNPPTGSPNDRKVAWCEPFSLPRRLDDRSRQLFALCGGGKWDAKDLKAFIDPILDFGMSFESAVSKVCKDHRDPGSPVFYSLHA
jgi:hypothetical protein